MTATVHYPGADERPLEAGWTLQVTAAGAATDPAALKGPGLRIAARVPGTAAEALAAAGLFDPARPTPLHDRDVWYFRSLAGEEPGPAILRFAGLATVAEVYWNGRLALATRNMFVGHDLPVELTGEDEIAVCFRALEPHLAAKGPRPRWRPRLADHQGLRLLRTSLLGRMPGWCPPVQPVGPWRPVSLIRPGAHALEALAVATDLDEHGTGRLAVSVRLTTRTPTFSLRCAGRSTPFETGSDGISRAVLTLPAIAAWWPHSHGAPVLHAASIDLGDTELSLGLVGFRRIEIDRGRDGREFALTVNGVRIFCRGAVWTSADLLALAGTAERYAPLLTLAREAGINMLRIAGTMAYETADFFRLCDRLGILVWQDMMLANYDYPATDQSFCDEIGLEVEGLVRSLAGSPSLAVLCGGSEVYQQGAMLGLPQKLWRGVLFTEVIPGRLRQLQPDTGGLPRLPDPVYVENSPSGGAMPFAPNAGVTHYYGVGAYLAPLDDARRADIRFAAECLAFAQVPQQRTLDRHLPVPPVIDPRWKDRVPRDPGASWDFDDVRDHYLNALYGFDASTLRRQDPARYLDVSRAVTGEVLEAAFAEWRRPASRCAGALVWTLSDLSPGAGWGVIDATGEPKPAWYAMRRAFRPLQVTLTDEGTNGLAVHVVNDGAQPRRLMLSLECLRDGATVVVRGERELLLPPRSADTIAATDLFGAFFDTNYAFRFGPPSHQASVARLFDGETGILVAEAFAFPLGRSAALFEADISSGLRLEDGQWWLDLSTERLAQSVHIACEDFRPEDDWFHLAPRGSRTVRLLPRDGIGAVTPSGTVSHLGSNRRFVF